MKYAVIILVIIVALVAAFFMFGKSSGTQKPPATSEERYENAKVGISFTYPEGFIVTEREVGTAQRGHHVISIVREEDATLPENGEGPTGVTIDIYQNNLDQQDLYAWMTGSSDSNFKLGPGTYATTSVAGTESVTYRWSGLYEGETTAFLHKDLVIAVSGTFMSPQDTAVGAYRMVLNSMTLK